MYRTLGAVLALFLFPIALLAQGVPQMVHYQGRVAVGGVNFNGTGGFKFALVNAAGSTTFWSNDGTSVGGGQPTGAVNLPVNRGLYSVLLGDPALSMVAIPATVFNNADVRLRIWFNDGTTGFQLLSPDQRIASVGYAMMAANVLDGAITTAKLADDAVTAAKIADGAIGAVNIANNSIGSLQLADSIDLGNTNTYGILNIFRAGSTNTPAIMLEGLNNQIVTYGDDGLIQTRLWGPSWGQLELHDSVNNDRVVQLNANSDGGGSLQLMTSNNATRVFLRATPSGSDLSMYAADGGVGVFVDGDSGGAGYIDIRNTNGSARIILDGEGANGGGFAELRNPSGQTGIQMRSLFDPTSTGAWMALYDGGQERISLAGQNGGTGVGGLIDIKNDSSDNTIRLIGDTGAGQGRIEMYTAAGTRTVNLTGQEAPGGSVLLMYNDAGQERVEIDADDGDNAAIIRLRGTNGATVITLDASVSGDGRITTQELQITGGSDLSEQFDVSSLREPVKAGMVVCIDPEKPGELVLSSKAYDRTAAGVISGAGGVKPGMLMGQKGTAADGQHPVALTGRVYCYVDASSGAIQPGDLLTTSDTPGHAMKVTDHTRAHGSIIGKAMSKLESGTGLVLVLVSLQ